MLFPATTHVENSPETWQVAKLGKGFWALQTKDGHTLDRFTTKHVAEQAKVSGFYVNLYRKEGRWYAGENVPGWKPYAACHQS